jgi:hypothetical protein
MNSTYANIYNNSNPISWQNSLLGRYVRKAYPKCSQRDIAYLFTQVADNVDQSSALTFWLASTSADPRYPFTGPTKRSYMSVDEKRLDLFTTIPPVPAATPPIPPLPLYGYRPRHAGESYYIYIEAKHYQYHVSNSLSATQAGGRPAAGHGVSPESTVRPWLKQVVTDNANTTLANYMNPDSYQLHCAGLDGRFSVNHDWLRKWPCGATGLKQDGSQQSFADFADDRDNQTNFSEGAMVTDAPAQ